MSVYGYHRTSTTEQHLDRGITEITNYCNSNGIEIVKIYTDQSTGKNFNRPRYTVLRDDVLREGDTLIITELDRLGRNKRDTMNEIRFFNDKGIRLMVLEIPTTLIDVTAMSNDMASMMLECISNMLLELYAAMAQSEIEKKEKRQREGYAAKKARGEWEDIGRPKAMDFERFCKEYQKVINGTVRPFELMAELGLTKPTYYRYVNRYKAERA